MTYKVLPSFVFFSVLCTGCTTTIGSFGEQTHFSYPNSNIEDLGHVKVSHKKGSFLIPPTFTAEDFRVLMEEALSRYAGADILINYKLNTRYVNYPWFYITSELILEGTAVQMEIGEQRLEERLKQYRVY